MAVSNPNLGLYSELQSFLAEATVKRAADDPGGRDGPTSHPVANAPDNTKPAPSGARSSENESDVKKMIPASVNAASENTASYDKQQLNIGLTQSATGDAPAIEKNLGTGPSDPGTSSLMTADDGKKYAAVDLKGKSFSDLYKMAGDIANRGMAKISVQGVRQTEQPKTAAAAPSPGTPPATTEDQRVKMAQAGYEMAGAIAAQNPGVTKQAQHDAVRSVLEETVRNAHLAADYTINHLRSEREKFAAAQKKAEDDAKPEESSDKPADTPSDPPPPPPADAGVGGPPAEGAGGSPETDPIQQLIMAVLEKGVTPEQLVHALEGLVGGAGGGAPGGMPGGAPGGIMPPPGGPAGAGGAPPMPPPPGGAPPGMEVAASQFLKLAKTARDTFASQVRDGSFRFTEAKTAKEKQTRTEIQRYVRELVR